MKKIHKTLFLLFLALAYTLGQRAQAQICTFPSHTVNTTVGSTVVISTVSSGTPPYNYMWSDGSPTGPLTTGVTDTVRYSGIYSVTVGDANPICFAILHDTITGLPCRMRDSLSYVKLSSYVYQFTAHSAYAYTPAYRWYLNGSYAAGLAATQTFTLTAGSTNTIVVQLLDSVTGCVRYDSTVVHVPVCNFLAYISQATTSYGDVMSVPYLYNGTAPYTYLWSTGSTNPIDTVYAPGIYFCTVTDHNGCMARPGDTIPTTPCFLRDSMAYVNNGGGSYLIYSNARGATRPSFGWTANSGSFYGSADYSYLYNVVPGQSYTIHFSLTDSATGCSLRDSIVIHVPACNVHGSITYTSSGSQFTFAAHSTGAAQPAYRWDISGGTQIAGYLNSQTVIFTMPTGGPLPVILQLYDTLTNCSTNDTIYVNNFACNFRDSLTYVNQGSNVYQFHAYVTGTYTSISWYLNNVFSGTGTTHTFTLNPGYNDVRVTVADSLVAGCQQSDSVLLNGSCNIRDSISYRNVGFGQYQFTAHLTGYTRPGISWYTSFGGGSFSSTNAYYTVPTGRPVAVICNTWDSVSNCQRADTVYLNLPACALRDSLAYTSLGANQYQVNAYVTGTYYTQFGWYVNSTLTGTNLAPVNYFTLQPGTHNTISVRLTDTITGCSRVDSISINPPACNLQPSITYTNLGSNHYQFTAHSSGTRPSYSWSYGFGAVYVSSTSNTITLSFASVGTYPAILFEYDSASNCNAIDTLYFSNCSMSGHITNSPFSGVTNLQALPSGGTGVYTYLWSANQGNNNQSSIIVSNNGIYNVTVTDDSTGCQVVLYDTVSNLSCNLHDSISYQYLGSGQYHFTAYVSGSTRPLIYWRLGATGTASGSPVNYTLPSGPQTVVLNVWDSITNCHNTDSITINVPCYLYVSILDTVYGGAPFQQAMVAGVGSYTYRWSDTLSYVSISAMPSSHHTGTNCVTVTDNNTGCTASACLPTAATCNLHVGITDTIQGGAPYQQAHVTGAIGYISYAWSDTAYNSYSINVVHHAGTNCVTVTDNSSGCTASACLATTTSCNITLRDSITNASSCGGLGTVRLYASGGTAPYQYRKGIHGTWQSASVFGSLTAGVDTFYVKDTTACTQSIIATITQANSMQLTDTLTQVGCAYNSGAVHVGVYGGSGGYQYRNGIHGTWQSSNIFSGLIVGSDTFYVQDASGCSRSIVVSVTRGTGYPTVAPTSNSPVAVGGTLTLAANAGGGATTYSWTGPNGFTSTSASPSIANVTTAAGGTYYVTASTGGTTSCNANGHVTVVVTGCTLAGSISSTVNSTYAILTANMTGGRQPFTYHWSNNASTSNVLTVTNSGNYCVTVTDSIGCVAVLCDSVSLGCHMAVTTTNRYLSGGAILTAVATGGNGHYLYHWSNGRNTAIDSVYNSGVYCVTVSDSTGCSAQACDSVNLNCHISGYLTNVSTGTFGLNRRFTAYPSGGTAPYTYHWSTSATTQSVVVSSFGFTHIQVTVTDAYGCSVVLSDTVRTSVVTTDTICGTVFVDANGDGVQDYGEVGLAGQVVRAGSYSATTNSSGHYLIPVPSGTYTITCTSPAGYAITIPVATTGVGTYSSVHITGGTQCGYNFGVMNSNVTISGYIYLDANNNGVKDAGETPVVSEQVHVGPHPVYTNSLGYYTWTGPAGSYNVVYTPSSAYSSYTAVPGSHFVNATSGGTVYSGNNFGLQLQTAACNIATRIITITTITAGYPAWYNVYVSNYGSNVASGTVTFYYDPALIYSSASPAPASVNTTTHAITFNYSGLLPGQYQVFTPSFTANSTVTIGQHTFEMATATDNCIESNFADNTDTVHQIATASWDPNVKGVTPTGAGPQGLIAADQLLRYTIDFQNTGTAPAINIVVADSIDPSLDITTLHVVAASHPDYAVQIEGRQLLCRFSQIMLPDSGTDQVASHGYLSFEILPVAGLAEGTQIHNSANIFFDYNDGVTTNTTLNTIDKALSISELESHATITVAPNPFRDYTTITVSGMDMKGATMEVTNMVGQVVSTSIPSADGIFRLDRGAMAAGVYIYSIKQANKTIGSGKLILEQ
jgi:uncharacterized repeat protein (TIGR01451 family)